jgi:hypothetical protein
MVTPHVYWKHWRPDDIRLTLSKHVSICNIYRYTTTRTCHRLISFSLKCLIMDLQIRKTYYYASELLDRTIIARMLFNNKLKKQQMSTVGKSRVVSELSCYTKEKFMWPSAGRPCLFNDALTATDFRQQHRKVRSTESCDKQAVSTVSGFEAATFRKPRKSANHPSSLRVDFLYIVSTYTYLSYMAYKITPTSNFIS